LQPGAQIGLRGPYGTAWPMQEAAGADVVVVAGGLGLAPLRPVVYDIMANRARFGRVSILLGSREPASLLYRHEVEEWRKRLDVDIQITVDHAGTDWRGNVGVVTDLIRRAAFDPPDTVAMVCGPEIMMRYAALALSDAGIPRQRIYVSMERNMKCAIGLCGHCQFGPTFVCKDGPVMSFDRIAPFFAVREI
ncbi:MAG: FAD/NAD(P)-binding protein, partial [Proteobacteria bacterium]|nr:FAD/NAD(P)-binding protein [Pseudomonadota bacterium]